MRVNIYRKFFLRYFFFHFRATVQVHPYFLYCTFHSHMSSTLCPLLDPLQSTWSSPFPSSTHRITYNADEHMFQPFEFSVSHTRQSILMTQPTPSPPYLPTQLPTLSPNQTIVHISPPQTPYYSSPHTNHIPPANHPPPIQKPHPTYPSQRSLSNQPPMTHMTSDERRYNPNKPFV